MTTSARWRIISACSIAVRERIALWEGAKGALLDEILGERDAIADSGQGRRLPAT